MKTHGEVNHRPGAKLCQILVRLEFTPAVNRLRPAWIDAWLERHAPEIRGPRRIDDGRNGAAAFRPG